MTDGTGKETVTDLELARMVRDLPREMSPERELWDGVQRQILDHPQKVRKPAHNTWMPYAVAASLVLAVSSIAFNLLQFQAGPTLPASSLDVMQQEYVQLRNPMVEEFARVNESLDPNTKQELYRNFEIMEQARLELEAQVRENPDNQRLVEMLLRIHEQELELLQQDYTQPSRSM